MSRLLTVFGATGKQGGAVIRHVLDHTILSNQYHLRGVTRDTSKPASQKLKEAGVEMVKADMDDPASLFEAVKDSYAVFSVTDFWATISFEAEVRQGKAIADASVSAGVQVLIWSSAVNITAASNGHIKYMVHLDSKAVVEEYIRTLPIRASFFLAGFYMQNYTGAALPREQHSDAELVIRSPFDPEIELPLIDIEDSGKYVAPVLLEPEKYAGKRLYAATGYVTSNELFRIWGEVVGKAIRYQHVSVEESLPPRMVEHFLRHDGRKFGLEGLYWGDGGKAGVEWTRQQVEAAGEKLTEIEDWARRDDLGLLKG